MRRILLATSVVLAASTLLCEPSWSREALRFDSCDDLNQYLGARQPNEHVVLAPATYDCEEPPQLSADGLIVDFGGTLLRVADHALRPGVVVGDLHTPARKRSRDVTVLNLRVDGNRANQEFECWDGPCNPTANDNPYWQQRLNGVTVNGCDGCVLKNIHVTAARSGGVVVIGSTGLLIDGLDAEGAHFDGLAGYVTTDSVFRNVRVHHNEYAGFSFDLDFVNNRIEDFEASNNKDHGVFIRYATGNTFVRGSFADNLQNGVYLDRANADDATCAIGTRFEDVIVSGSGLYGAWLDFGCQGNEFVSAQLVDNAHGCFGGLHADRIGRSGDTRCVAPAPVQPEETVQAKPGEIEG